MLSFVVSVLVGIVVGIVSGMLGVGGGMVMIPAFRLGYGMAALQVTATSLFTIIPTSVAGLITHLRNRTCVPAVGLVAGISGACLSPLGVYLASISPSWLVMLAGAAVIAYGAVTMFRKALAMPPSGKRAQSEQSGEHAANPLKEEAPALAKAKRSEHGEASSPKPLHQDGMQSHSACQAASPVAGAGSDEVPITKGLIVRTLIIGIVAGVASGYVGVGGGFIMIPLFVSVLGVGMKKASGTSLIAVSILAVPGVIGQMMLGNVLLGTGIAIAVGSIPGAIVGANLSKRVPERMLRFIFSGMLLVAAASLALNELSV